MTLTTRLAVAMILVVAIAVSAVGWLSYRSVEQALLPRVLDSIETHSRFVASDLESNVSAARADITTFQGLAAVIGMMRARLNDGMDPVDHIPETVWRERLGNRLAAQLALQPSYSPFRFIGLDDGPRRIRRVDPSRPHRTLRLAPAARQPPA